MTTYSDVAILKSDGYIGLVWQKGRCYYQILGKAKRCIAGGTQKCMVVGRLDDIGKKHYVPKKDFKKRMENLSFIEAFRITAGDIIGLQTM